MRIAIDLRPYPGQTHTARAFQMAWVRQFKRTFPDWSLLLLVTENEKDKFVDGAQTHVSRGPGFWENLIRLPRMIKSAKTDLLLSFTPSPIRVSLPKMQLGFDHLANGLTLAGNPGLGNTRPLEEGVFEQIRGRFTQGRPYFLYYPDNLEVPDLSVVLRAYSIFKKWNQSSYKLVVVADQAGPMSDKVRFQSYKYREDVELIEDDDSFDREALIAGAFATILHPRTPGYGLIAAFAASHSIPVIAPYPVPFSCSFLESDTTQEKSLGEAMNRMYTSEGRWPVHSPEGGESGEPYWEAVRRQLTTAIG